jgi:hypothetical protein
MTYKPGQSGNPTGRPKGARDRKNVVAAEFSKQGSEVARVVVGKALEGDMTAASLVLTRLSPPLRPQAEKVQFELDPDAPIADQAKQILMAVSEGRIDPDTARILFDCCSAFVGLKDVESFLGELKRMREAKNDHIAGGVVEQ